MVFLTYMNPVYTYGKERFMGRCVECGIDGLLIPDLPFEEKGELKDVCEAHGVEILSFIAGGSKSVFAGLPERPGDFFMCLYRRASKSPTARKCRMSGTL